jgi:hypothetical protein
VPEFIDPVFAKTSSKRSFSMSENERFGLVFAKTGSINLGKDLEPVTGSFHLLLAETFRCTVCLCLELDFISSFIVLEETKIPSKIQTKQFISARSS